MFSPTIKALHPGSLDYLARYNIKSTSHITDDILNVNFSIGVSAFRLLSFVSYLIPMFKYTALCYMANSKSMQCSS